MENKQHKITKSVYVSSDAASYETALIECLEHVCHAFDLAAPVIVSKHAKDLLRFHRIVFRPADFLEPVRFDSLVLEVVDES